MSSIDPSDINNFVPAYARFVLDQEEQWKPIPDFLGYEISDYGRARCFRGRIKGSGCRYKYGIVEKPFFLKPHPLRSGHYQYILFRDGKRFQFHAAQLVLMVFDRFPEEGEEARHVIDPTVTNNCLYNLAWGTRQQNVIDCVHHGNHPLAILTVKDVLQIKKYLAAGVHQRDIAEEYGVKQPSISDINRGKTWAHVQVQQGDRDVLE